MTPEPDRSASPEEFARALGLNDADLAAELFVASGGRLSLGRTVTKIASQAALPTDIASASFADYVAEHTPEIGIGISDEDEWAAAVLAHLGVFTRQTALLALTAMPPEAIATVVPLDPEGALMRLQIGGVLVPTAETGQSNTFRIPVLIAAKLRYNLGARADPDTVIEALAKVLIDHLESAKRVDPSILADVLVLARRGGLWSEMVRIQDSVGLPVFLLAPQETCKAFGHLPAAALSAAPELRLLSELADDVVDRSHNGLSSVEVRSILIEETRPGRLRQRSLAGLAQEAPDWASQLGAGGQSVEPIGSVGAGTVGTIRAMLGAETTGNYARAAELGLRRAAETSARRARLVLRLLAAVACFHSSQIQRAISLLNEVEAAAEGGHVTGDFLLPGALAWSALASTAGGDHERADLKLVRLSEEFSAPLTGEELVRPAEQVATALRALDRLDLECADAMLQRLASFPETQELRVDLPVIARTLSLLRADSCSGLLFVNDDVEKYYHTGPISATGADRLGASRTQVFIGLGQLRWAELELQKLSATTDLRTVLAVRLELVAGRTENAITLVEAWFYHQTLSPRSRAELAAIKAAALLRLGRETEARAEFLTAVGLSAWLRSLLPLALLPQSDRVRLLDLVAGASELAELDSAFPGRFASSAELLDTLRIVGTVSVGEVSVPQLSEGESQLLDLVAQGLSIAQISTTLQQVPGTVKNRLSALYRRFEVSSRAEVVNRARSLGFLLPG